MNKFLLGTPGAQEQIESKDLSEMLSGRSILSISDFPNRNYLVLELSGDVNMSLSGDAEGIFIRIVPTTGPDKTSPLLVSLGDMPRRVSLNEMQRKLNGLRTLYAMYFLIYSDKASDLENLLRKNPDADIENALLTDDERLYVESISHGSWNLVVWGKNFEKILWVLGTIMALVSRRGREALMRNLEAEARLKEAKAKMLEAKAEKLKAQAEKIAIDNEKEQLKHHMKPEDYVSKVINKFSYPETKKIAKQVITKAVGDLVSGDKHDYDAAKVIEEELD